MIPGSSTMAASAVSKKRKVVGSQQLECWGVGPWDLDHPTDRMQSVSDGMDGIVDPSIDLRRPMRM
uniref:Uncharacterized protein n=1 Tax=Aegilops tauschii subsp. strangulata TaxID=200361 RepID=A0A453KHB7_AEGTS